MKTDMKLEACLDCKSCSRRSASEKQKEMLPFMFSRSRDGKAVNLVCFDKTYCQCLEKISPAEFLGCKMNILRLIRSEGIVDAARKSPGMILDYDPCTSIVQEIVELKKS